jgi:hypothetical protein
MAKIQGESKLAIAGALTLALAGVLLVKEPLRSSRPVGTGLEMKQTTGDQLVRARLWEDPLEGVYRALNESTWSPERRTGRCLYERVRLIRTSIEQRLSEGHSINVLLLAPAGGPCVESSESRIHDRYALGGALNVGCYVQEDEGNLSFLEWDSSGAIPALPYEWYRQGKTRLCGVTGVQADSIAVVWLPDEALHQGFLATLTSLSQAIVCKEQGQNVHDGGLVTADKPKLVQQGASVPLYQQPVIESSLYGLVALPQYFYLG